MCRKRWEGDLETITRYAEIVIMCPCLHKCVCEVSTKAKVCKGIRWWGKEGQPKGGVGGKRKKERTRERERNKERKDRETKNEKEKEKETRKKIRLYLAFYFLNNLVLLFNFQFRTAPPSFFSFFIFPLHYFNGYILALMCQWLWKIRWSKGLMKWQLEQRDKVPLEQLQRGEREQR